MDFLIDILKDALIDSVKLLPFLFISYLVIELIEHKISDKVKNFLINSGKFGSVIGAILGVIPQCGFSVTASTLYAGRVITAGTLIAVFISTSDEALPILLSSEISGIKILPIILIKICLAIATGIFIDFFFIKKDEHSDKHEEAIEEHIHEMCHDCSCEKGHFLISVLKHTISIFFYVLIFNVILNIIIYILGEENLSKIMLTGNIFQPVLAGILGIIPNCASSILLTKLYIDGTISFASVISGLSVGSGVGYLVLFKVNKNIKENLKILFATFGTSVLFGMLLEIVEVFL